MITMVSNKSCQLYKHAQGKKTSGSPTEKPDKGKVIQSERDACLEKNYRKRQLLAQEVTEIKL